MIQRRAVVGTVIAASGLLLSGCGFQSPAVTDHEHNSIQAADLQVGPIRVRAASVTTLETTATKSVTYVRVTLVNDSPTGDTLTGITTAAGPVSLAGSGVFNGGLTVPPDGVPVIVTEPVLNPDGPTATLAATATPGTGTYVPISFTFANAGTTRTAQVPVVPPALSSSPTSPVPQIVATPPVEEGQPASD